MDLVDLYQFQQVRNVRRDQNRLGGQIDHQRAVSRDRDADIDERIDRLVMINEALWELLRDTAGMTEDHLLHKLAEIDGRDGDRDGRRRVAPMDCSCGAKVSVKQKVCTFCGEPPAHRTAFDWV